MPSIAAGARSAARSSTSTLSPSGSAMSSPIKPSGVSPGGSSLASSALSSACAFSLTALPLKSIKEPYASETAQGNKTSEAGSEQAPDRSDCSTSKGSCVATLPQGAPGDANQAATHPQQGSFGLGKAEVLQSKAAAGRSEHKGSPMQGGAHRSSLEDMRQAQLALASFPGHLTESQASAVAGVRSRLREMAQGSAGVSGQQRAARARQARARCGARPAARAWCRPGSPPAARCSA